MRNKRQFVLIAMGGVVWWGLMLFLGLFVAALFGWLPEGDVPVSAPVTGTVTPVRVAVVTPSPMVTVTPSPVATSTRRVTETPAVTPTLAAGLPGLYPADIKVNLIERGFDCGEPELGDSGEWYIWSCEKSTADYDFLVSIHSRHLLSVDWFEAVAFFYGEADVGLAGSFFGFLATMPFDGAEPMEARVWVEENLGNTDMAMAEFGGVLYQLISGGEIYSLDVGWQDAFLE